MGIILATLTLISGGSASAGREMRLLSLGAMIARPTAARVDSRNVKEGRTMKKTYEKPKLEKRQKLSRVTAVAGPSVASES